MLSVGWFILDICLALVGSSWMYAWRWLIHPECMLGVEWLILGVCLAMVHSRSFLIGRLFDGFRTRLAINSIPHLNNDILTN